MGAGSGTLAASTLDTASTLTIDTTNYKGTIDTGILVASGAGTISMGGGDFSGSSISMAGNFTSGCFNINNWLHSNGGGYRGR